MPVSKHLRTTAEHGLYSRLRELTDGESLIAWGASLPAPGSLNVAELESAGLLFMYRAGRPRSWHAYLVGLHEPGDATGPGSLLPPPSLQAAATWVMYTRRDRGTCHLCRRPVINDWKRPTEFQSLDHLIPRSKGGRDYPSNIRLAHTSCNKGRRDREVSEFRAWLAANRADQMPSARAA